MSAFIDLTGRRFGRLVAIEPSNERKCSHVVWKCLCDCGNYKYAISNNLLRGYTSSCGCLHKQGLVAMTTTHGMCKTRLYSIWSNMKDRCLNPNIKGYENYGGRGIAVCDEWMEFAPFAEWALANGYSDDLTIDRINNNEGYSPSNCRWATRFVQANNQRSNHLFTIDGVTHTMTEWGRIYGINKNLVFDRLRRGWSEYETLTIPKGGKRCRR